MGRKSLDIYLLPALLEPEKLAGKAVVMTDVLRASTTMTSALQNGAAAIWPHADIESARSAAADHESALLCGERGGQIIDGFDLGNSPREFPEDVVTQKTIVHCTTNGTLALESCRRASHVFIGSFANLSASVEALLRSDHSAVLCAGTHGEITGEDVLYAGAVVQRIQQQYPELAMNDQAQIALSHWLNAQSQIENGSSLFEILCQCDGGKNLVKIGYEKDIEFCAGIDHFQIVPELNIDQWRIRIRS